MTKKILSLGINDNLFCLLVIIVIAFALLPILKFILDLIELLKKHKKEKSKENVELTKAKNAYVTLKGELEIKQKDVELDKKDIKLKEKEIEIKNKDFLILKQKLHNKALNSSDETIKSELFDMIALIKD